MDTPTPASGVIARFPRQRQRASDPIGFGFLGGFVLTGIVILLGLVSCGSRDEAAKRPVDEGLAKAAADKAERARSAHELSQAALRHLEQGQNDLASAEISKAIEIDPKNPIYRVFKGNFALRSENAPEAESSFLEALKLDPVNPKIYWHLGQATELLGKTKESLEAYRKCLANLWRAEKSSVGEIYYDPLGNAYEVTGLMARVSKRIRELENGSPMPPS